MKRFRTLRSTLLACGLLALAPGAFAQDAGTDDALVQDARKYAATYEVDLDEALSRLRLQGPIGNLAAQLAKDEPAAFGGLWIQHSPYRVVVQFTEGGGRSLQNRFQAKDLSELGQALEQRTVKLSLRQLEKIQVEAHRLAQRNKLPADSRINVIENRVELLTENPAAVLDMIRTAPRSSKAAAALDLPAHVDVLEVERRITPHAYVLGGLNLTDCTSGYTVQNGSGTLGIATAGHCPNTLQYNNRSLPFQGEAFSGASDAQWHTAPELHLTNRVWDGQSDTTTPNYRMVTATKARAAQVIGEFVCKFGITTGYTCGTISSTTFTPSSYVPSASAAFVYVDSPTQDQSEPGDSGGPWFSGETAYGIHSGGYIGGGGSFNAAVYMAIDNLAPLGVTVVTTPPNIPLGRWTYRNVGNNIQYFTGINADEYECSVAGFAAIDGDINENDSGDIIQTYVYRVNNHWQIRGDFRAHNNQESWDFDLLCLKKSAYPVTRYEYRNLGGNINYNTGLSTTTYECGIAGMAGRDGDIDEGGAADILQSYAYRNGGTWWLRADFHSHNNGESWDIDLMCVEKWAAVTRHEYRNLGNNVTYNTFLNSNTHECGVAGLATRNGDIQEHDSGNIILSYLTKTSGTWTFRGDFRTHNNHESWDVDILCIQK